MTSDHEGAHDVESSSGSEGDSPAGRSASGSDDTVYEYVGGEEFFTRLVDEFYDGVADDPLLRPLYPDDDLAGANERLRLFLIQYWGGPTTYSDTRGHPRLRMRHAGFPVGPDTQAAWLGHMTAAVEATAPPEPARSMMLDYFRNAVEHLRNS